MELPSNDSVVIFLSIDQVAGTVPVKKDFVKLKSTLSFLHRQIANHTVPDRCTSYRCDAQPL